MVQADYTIGFLSNSTLVLIDLDLGNRSVTNDVQAILLDVHDRLPGGLGNRRIFYQDSQGDVDEINHYQAEFLGFKSCSLDQQAVIKRMLRNC